MRKTFQIKFPTEFSGPYASVCGYLGLCPAFIQLEGELREPRDVSGSKGLKFVLGERVKFSFLWIKRWRFLLRFLLSFSLRRRCIENVWTKFPNKLFTSIEGRKCSFWLNTETLYYESCFRIVWKFNEPLCVVYYIYLSQAVKVILRNNFHWYSRHENRTQGPAPTPKRWRFSINFVLFS